MMARPEKVALVEELKDNLSRFNRYATDYRGLDVGERRNWQAVRRLV